MTDSVSTYVKCSQEVFEELVEWCEGNYDDYDWHVDATAVPVGSYGFHFSSRQRLIDQALFVVRAKDYLQG